MGLATRKPKIISIRNTKHERERSGIVYLVDRVSLQEGSEKIIHKEFGTFNGAMQYLSRLGFDVLMPEFTRTYPRSRIGINANYEGEGYIVYEKNKG